MPPRTYKFAYSPVTVPPTGAFPSGQTIYRPLLQTRVVVGQKELVCIAWPDSGADHCVFPLSFASVLGLDPLQMKMQMTGGVGSPANPTYYAEVTVNIHMVGDPVPFSWTTLAGFTVGLEAQGLALLGQVGFFESFQVTFSHKHKWFTISG